MTELKEYPKSAEYKSIKEMQKEEEKIMKTSPKIVGSFFAAVWGVTGSVDEENPLGQCSVEYSCYICSCSNVEEVIRFIEKKYPPTTSTLSIDIKEEGRLYPISLPWNSHALMSGGADGASELYQRINACREKEKAMIEARKAPNGWKNFLFGMADRLDFQDSITQKGESQKLRNTVSAIVAWFESIITNKGSDEYEEKRVTGDSNGSDVLGEERRTDEEAAQSQDRTNSDNLVQTVKG